MDDLRKARKAHVPRDVWRELEDIKKEQNIKEQSEAFRIMASNSKVGRTAEKMARGLIPEVFWRNKNDDNKEKQKRKR